MAVKRIAHSAARPLKRKSPLYPAQYKDMRPHFPGCSNSFNMRYFERAQYATLTELTATRVNDDDVCLLDEELADE